MRELIKNNQHKFWKNVDKTGDCWIWITYKDKLGYGYFQFCDNRKKYNLRASRVSMEIATGNETPNDIFVCHRCDNPTCVNPDHLFLGTHQDNMDDMVKKGRSPLGEKNSNYIHGKFTLIEKAKRKGKINKFQNGSTPLNCTLTPEKVIEIKNRIKNKSNTLKEIAIEFNVKETVIRDISAGRTYKNILVSL